MCPLLSTLPALRRFWGLLGIVIILHSVNSYRDAYEPPEPELPDGAARRLPDGGLLMVDGSIGKDETNPRAPHRLHRVTEVGHDELALDRAWRKIKETV